MRAWGSRCVCVAVDQGRGDSLIADAVAAMRDTRDERGLAEARVWTASFRRERHVRRWPTRSFPEARQEAERGARAARQGRREEPGRRFTAAIGSAARLFRLESATGNDGIPAHLVHVPRCVGQTEIDDSDIGAHARDGPEVHHGERVVKATKVARAAARGARIDPPRQERCHAGAKLSMARGACLGDAAFPTHHSR